MVAIMKNFANYSEIQESESRSQNESAREEI
jgi:hypothetical protein